MLSYRQRRRVLFYLYLATDTTRSDHAHSAIHRALALIPAATHAAQDLHTIIRIRDRIKFREELELVVSLLEIEQAVAAQDRGTPCALTRRSIQSIQLSQ